MRRIMVKNTSVTASTLRSLGTKRLADLLLEACQDNPSLKRRLRFELAGKSGPDVIAIDIGKRLISLKQAHSFIDWQKCRAFAKDIDLLRQMIVEKVAEERPDLALDLLWRFMALASPTIERVDDSNGNVSEVFRAACADLGTVAAKGSPDPIRLADRVLEALTSNTYGQYDHLVAAIFPALGETGVQHLKQQLTAALKQPAGKDVHGIRSNAFKSALQDIADQQGDVDAFIAQESQSARKTPAVAASIGQRLLAASRPREALEVLKNAVREQEAPSTEDLEDDLLYGPNELGVSQWGDVWVEALVANNRLSEAQQFRWSRFERYLDSKSLQAYLKALPDFEDIEAEQKAIQHALTFPHFATALQFLINWPDHHGAAHLVLHRCAEVNGNLYFLLDPAAKALEDPYPHIATLLYRAMIEDTLKGAKSTRYGHAARHLLACQSLLHLTKNQDSIESHSAFLARIKANHSRKTGFWSRVAESGALSPQ
jgi:hypothetical protein